MSTKKTTDNNIKYDPGSMNAFTALQPLLAKNLTAFMDDPLKQQGFNLALQQMYKGNQNSAQRMVNSLYSNMNAGGFGGGNMNAFTQSQLSNIGRSKSAMDSNSFLNNFMNFKNLQFAATGQAQGYKPLQTGSTTTEQTSGLGTWLPQVIGAGVGLAAGAMTGGTSMLGSSLARAGAGAAMNTGAGLFTGAMQSNNNASASNPWLYQQPGQGYTPFGGNH